MSLHAISIKAPWPWAIFNAGKTVENRSWKLPWQFTNRVLLLHSGKKRDDFDADLFIRGISGAFPPEDLPLGAIVGIIRFTRDFTTWIGDPSPWWIGTQVPGTHGWLIGNAMPLVEPIPCKGQRGFWQPKEAAGLEPYVCTDCKLVTMSAPAERVECCRCAAPTKRAVAPPPT